MRTATDCVVSALPKNVSVKDTTGAGDSFCAGVASGLTYGKTLPEAVEIGTRLGSFRDHFF